MMDPVSVLKVLWRHKVIATLVLGLTVAAAAAMWLLPPRVYQAEATFAIVNPDVPSADEMQNDPNLALLNSDNPFLRSSEPSLIAQVIVMKVNSDEVVDAMEVQGYSSEFEVAQGGRLGPGLIIDVKADAPTEKMALETVQALGEVMEAELYSVQKVNGADDIYLFSMLPIEAPSKAIEQFSDRIRLVIVVVVGGFALLFGAVSLARSIDLARRRRVEETEAEGHDLNLPFASHDIAAWGKPSRTSGSSRTTGSSLSPRVSSPLRAGDGTVRRRKSGD